MSDDMGPLFSRTPSAQPAPRLHIRIGDAELTVVGPPEFAKTAVEWFHRLLESGSPIDRGYGSETQVEVATSEPPDSASLTTMPTAGDPTEPGSEFGEYLHRFASSQKDNDLALIAAYFAQKCSDDDSFRTSDISRLLTAQGVKLANPSNCVKRNKERKTVFALATKGTMRVSRAGVERLRALAEGAP